MADVITLCFLVLLQAVLGFDNLLYISLESKRVLPERRAFVRRVGIGLAIVMRIALLFVVLELVDRFQHPMFGIHQQGYLEASFSLHSVIVLGGGVFVLYTALKEIFHMVHIDRDPAAAGAAQRSTAGAVFWIVVMNMVFSFDSILSAMALTKVFWVMAAAIVISGIMMMWLADRVSTFLARNRVYEVLGLFVLFVVGVMLVTEGGHLAELTLFGHRVEQMSKATFYFVIAVLVVTDLVQSRYQKKVLLESDPESGPGA
ncbi:MAG: tellurium resistance protein TerC [Planctomycetes bacterium]|nr:tellurium resistance protein TerC [Planctomycetota bacterium]